MVGVVFAALPTRSDSQQATFKLQGDVACELCHRQRHQLFKDGVHGQVDLQCLDCHENADQQHVESLGKVAAPHPRNFSGSQANNLCVDCHQVRTDKFMNQHRKVDWQQRPVCISCHDFHELSQKLATQSPIKFSHQAGVARDFKKQVAEFPVRGGISLGYRFLDGANPGFDTNIQLGDGILIRELGLETELSDGSQLKLEARGYGESTQNLRVSWQQVDSFESSFSWRRFEALFNPDSELHDMFTKRDSYELNWQTLDGDLAEVKFGWQRFERDSTSSGTRYRPPSNALFNNASGERSESIDNIFADWKSELGNWQFTIHPSLRWWKENDRREFAQFNAAVGQDDFENLRSQSSGLNPSLLLSANTKLGDDVHWGNELFTSYASRSYQVEGESGGELAVGGPYSGSLSADGQLRGRYLRFESSAWWQFSEKIVADLRVRIRRESEDATIPFSEALNPDPGANSVDQLAELDNSLSGIDVEALARTKFADWLSMDVGFGLRAERLRVDGSSSGSPRDRGLLFGLRTKELNGWSLRANSRAFVTADPFTVISADSRQRNQIGVRWQGSSALGFDSAWSRSDVRYAIGDDFSELQRAHLFATWEDGASLSARAGASWSSYASELSSIANTPMPSPWIVMFNGRTFTWHASAATQLSSSLKVRAGLDLIEVLGDNTSDLSSSYFAFTKAWNPMTEVGLIANWWLYDGIESDRDDFDVIGLEVFVSRLF